VIPADFEFRTYEPGTPLSRAVKHVWHARGTSVFTGLTPTEYVEQRRRAWGRAVEPGEAPNFVPELIR
jgi:hypothetical protein